MKRSEPSCVLPNLTLQRLSDTRVCPSQGLFCFSRRLSKLGMQQIVIELTSLFAYDNDSFRRGLPLGSVRLFFVQRARFLLRYEVLYLS